MDAQKCLGTFAMPIPAKLDNVTISLELTDAQAWVLAQLLKRIGFSEFKANAVDEEEAYAMRDAAALVARTLADAGYAPR